MYQHSYEEVSLCLSIFPCFVLVLAGLVDVEARRYGARRAEGRLIICGVCVPTIPSAVPNATSASDGSGSGGAPDSTPKLL